MSKIRTFFICRSCGERYPRWEGRCNACGEWNTLEEEHEESAPKGGGGAARAAASLKAGSPKSEGVPSRRWTPDTNSSPLPIDQIDPIGEQRASTGIGELDRILGGGLVAGSAVLIGGEPGIGKSTLMLQAAFSLARPDAPTLYVTGEESLEQVRLRAARLGTVDARVQCLAETRVESVGEQIQALRPSAVVLDSIQTAWTPEATGAPGSPTQIRESAAHLIYLAKALRIPIFIVGHVTKAGTVAGPRILEHMVDTVLYFEGDRHHQLRVLRSVKNRFGSTNEIGVFEMSGDGLTEVTNPSELFLQERAGGASGSVVTAVMEGSRPLLMEVQALATPNGGYAPPRRVAAGIDPRRLLLLIAVLEKRLGMRMIDQDVYVNVPGGATLQEPAADLAVLCAIASSVRNEPIDAETIVVGEVGLAGEVRSVAQLAKRLGEAHRMGYRRAIASAKMPKSRGAGGVPTGLTVVTAATVGEALRHLGL